MKNFKYRKSWVLVFCCLYLRILITYSYLATDMIEAKLSSIITRFLCTYRNVFRHFLQICICLIPAAAIPRLCGLPPIWIGYDSIPCKPFSCLSLYVEGLLFPERPPTSCCNPYPFVYCWSRRSCLYYALCSWLTSLYIYSYYFCISWRYLLMTISSCFNLLSWSF